jgi:hypothetical protein
MIELAPQVGDYVVRERMTGERLNSCTRQFWSADAPCRMAPPSPPGDVSMTNNLITA